MNIFLQNIKLICKNYKQAPKQALLTSYNLLNNNNLGFLLLVLFAVLSGVCNALSQKYLPISLFKSLDKLILNWMKPIAKLMGETSIPSSLGLSDYFKTEYSPNIIKYFFTGAGLFVMALALCTLICYIIRTNLFKAKDNVMTLLLATVLCLAPSVILPLIASVCSVFSTFAYLIFVSLGVISFIIYFYEHLKNVTKLSSDSLCFISSISFIVLLLITLKLDQNIEIINMFLKPLQEEFQHGFQSFF